MSANGSIRICSFEGCGYAAMKMMNLCATHRAQQRDGRPLAAIKRHRRRNSGPVIAYDEAPCPRADLEGPCHIYRGGKNKGGYGQLLNDSKQIGVHQYVWIQTHGPVLNGFVIDHQCRNKACCNVRHLRAVTHRVNATENVEGMIWQKKIARTHCLRGHEYTKENTAIIRYHGKTSRRCRQCARVIYRDYYHRKHHPQQVED